MRHPDPPEPRAIPTQTPYLPPEILVPQAPRFAHTSYIVAKIHRCYSLLNPASTFRNTTWSPE